MTRWTGPARAWRSLGVAGVCTSLLLVGGRGAAAQQPAQNPHGALPDSLQCSACHTAEGWTVLRKPLGFEHGARTGFRLTGAHVHVACMSCHTRFRFDEPTVDADACATCHADIHQGRMLQDCSVCHSTASFHDVDGARIHARTSFPLTGAHRQVTCEACHVTDAGGAFSRIDPECVSCHMKDYRSARIVDHVAADFPTTCTVCHGTVAWNDTRGFDHAALSGGFQLLGAHATAACTACHAVPGYALLFPDPAGQDDCMSCHQSQFNTAHGGQGFPTTCAMCHTVSAWSPSTFDHDAQYFPIYSGAHSGQWSTCTECHTAAGDFSTFSCIDCHEHSQSNTDPHHTEVRGYVYESTACYSCHRNGRGG